MSVVLSLHLMCKCDGLGFIIEPIRRDSLFEPEELSPAPYNPRTRVGVAVSKVDETIPGIRYDGDILHENGARDFFRASRICRKVFLRLTS